MIIARVPLRISFAGGMSDIPRYYEQYGGEVVGTAIDKYMYAVVKRRYDPDIYVNWTQKEIVSDPSKLRHEIIKACLWHYQIDQAIEITTLCDIPGGTGLGSSSAVTLAVLAALQRYTRPDEVEIPRQELIELACQIELEKLGKPIGKQDHYFCGLGGIRHLFFAKAGGVALSRAFYPQQTINHLNSRLLLFYTEVTRNSDTILSGDFNFEEIHEIRALVKPMSEALWKGTTDNTFGILLDKGWQRKQNAAKGITDPYLDSIYETALNAGAIGGKLLGAGGGGFFLFDVPLECQDNVRHKLGLREYPISVNAPGLDIYTVP